MSADSRRARYRPARHETGTAAVEFAMLVLLFLTFVFGIIEVARLAFVYNTLQEVTRRAAQRAAQVYPTDQAALARIRANAVFRDTSGPLVLAPPITDADVRIDYMALVRDADLSMHLQQIPDGTWAPTPALNRLLCMGDMNAPTCIRFVRARVCDKGDPQHCSPVRSHMLLLLLNLPVQLHVATTIVATDSPGYQPGDVP